MMKKIKPILIRRSEVGGSFEPPRDECDCACATIATPRIVKVPLSAMWRKSEDLYSYPLLTNYAIFNLVDTLASVVILDHQACRVLDVFTEPNNFRDVFFRLEDLSSSAILAIFEQLSSLNLLVPFPDYQPLVHTLRPKALIAWLHLTDRCNFRCDYCYLSHVHEDMSPEIGCAAIESVFRSAITNGLKQVKLKYVGGEPLLRFPFITELHHYAQSLAEQHEVDLEGVVLSNGTMLTAEMVKTLKSLGLRLMISLDGLGAFHDAHRRYVGGRGSFVDVAGAIDLVLANGLPPNISVTISSRTADGLPDILAWILERELPFSLNFYRENELSASHDDMRLDEDKIINGMLAAFKVIKDNLPRRPFLGGIIDRANLSASHTHTCGVGQNYLVFDQNGQVAKCQMQIGKPIADVHTADLLAIVRADQTGIQNISVEEKEGCKSCEWRYWCSGGCPLTTYRVTGRYDIKSPNCNIYKALFPEALRLEGLRLLKYQDDPEVVQKIVV